MRLDVPHGGNEVSDLGGRNLVPHPCLGEFQNNAVVLHEQRRRYHLLEADLNIASTHIPVAHVQSPAAPGTAMCMQIASYLNGLHLQVSLPKGFPCAESFTQLLLLTQLLLQVPLLSVPGGPTLGGNTQPRRDICHQILQCPHCLVPILHDTSDHPHMQGAEGIPGTWDFRANAGSVCTDWDGRQP